ncbi:MAG: helix-turn-helix transcriptional regulator [Candidatus Gastranaerophilales bacterium]|nr:helix-turn-helix transcriptional regulator [Candidatus Gastranaerophilales bacterium]
MLIMPQNWNMSQDIKQILAQNIQKLRIAKNLRREELSLSLGFDNSYISKLEKGKVNITINRLQLIADYLGVKASELLI